MPHNCGNFRMIGISGDQNKIAGSGVFFHDPVDLRHKGTGGIYNGKACIFQVFLDLASHAVRPDDDCPRFQPMQIFILRNDAAGEGITSRELVEEARRVAHNYASSGTSRFSSRWRTLNPIVYTLIGAGTIGLAWLIAALA